MTNVVDAMSDELTLFLDEIVVPDKNVEWYVTQTDLAMMAQFPATERTETQWRQLLEKARLKVREIVTYMYGFNLSIIKASKA